MTVGAGPRLLLNAAHHRAGSLIESQTSEYV